MGIITNHYKDPYFTTSIMENKRVYFRGQVVSYGEILQPNGAEKTHPLPNGKAEAVGQAAPRTVS